MEEIYPMGRRYPKRLRDYQPQPENKTIYVAGIEIGFMISNVPYLHADAWKGTGVPMSNVVQKANSINPARAASGNRKKPVAGAAARANEENKQQQNNKKRRSTEALKMGSGLSDYQKDEVAFKIEEALPFIKQMNEPNCPYEFVGADENYNQGKQYKI